MKTTLLKLKKFVGQYITAMFVGLAAGIPVAQLPPLDARLAAQLSHVAAHPAALAASKLITDTTPTFAEFTSNITDLVGAWGVYIGIGLIFGLAVFAVYRFVRAAR